MIEHHTAYGSREAPFNCAGIMFHTVTIRRVRLYPVKGRVVWLLILIQKAAGHLPASQGAVRARGVVALGEHALILQV